MSLFLALCQPDFHNLGPICCLLWDSQPICSPIPAASVPPGTVLNKDTSVRAWRRQTDVRWVRNPKTLLPQVRVGGIRVSGVMGSQEREQVNLE